MFAPSLDVLSGRPVFAFFRYIEWELKGGVNDLWMQKTFSVITTILFAVTLYMLIRKREIFKSELSYFTFPLLISLLPAFQVYNSWGTCYPFVLGITFSLLSYFFAHDFKFKSKITGLIISVIFISMAFATYQPSGMVFMSIVFIDTCLTFGKVNIAKIAKSALIMLCGVISSLLMIKVVPYLIYGKTINRAEPVKDLFDKMQWFISEPLINSVNNFNIQPTITYTIISVIFLFIGLLFISQKEHGFYKVVLFPIIAVVSYAPNLYINENWAAFRSLIPIEICLTSVIVYGFLRFFEQKKSIGVIVSVAAIVFAGTTATKNITKYFVMNQTAELEAISYAIAESVPKDFTGTVMGDPKDQVWMTAFPLVRYDEFGSNSSYAPWAFTGILATIKKTHGYNYTVLTNPFISEKNECKENCILIKISDALKKSAISN